FLTPYSLFYHLYMKKSAGRQTFSTSWPPFAKGGVICHANDGGFSPVEAHQFLGPPVSFADSPLCEGAFD
ncbi:hypothetical protein, partial [Flintibacter muris]|uniref:hypothetical protein n=1 Tax=Flintibacter muris TaxID=2941327 RepID=UPI00203D1A56